MGVLIRHAFCHKFEWNNKVTKSKVMEKVLFLAVALTCFSQCSSVGVEKVKVFYVKPTVPTDECPSGDSPCHSLQYYANHSSFTNNNRFLFLEGQHDLDSVVEIRNVVNLSLVGASSRVKIACNSLPTGFYMENFNLLSFEYLTLSNCRGVNNSALYMIAGSEVIVSHVTISTMSEGDAQIVAVNVMGLFSVMYCDNTGSHNGSLLVNYSVRDCNRPCLFNFSNNILTGLFLDVNCSDVHISITDSLFQFYLPLGIQFDVSTRNSIFINNSQFNGGQVSIGAFIDCRDLKCEMHVKFTNVIIDGGRLLCVVPTRSAVLFEDSMFSSVTFGPYNSTTRNDTSVQAVFQRVTFANGRGNEVLNAAVMFINCTFENSTDSALDALDSRLIFQGNNIFRNNSALIGAGIFLTLTSYMHFQPHTEILFDNNHAVYVGGAIYTEQCFFDLDSHTLNGTINVNFINNTAGSSGSSLYSASDIGDCCNNLPCEEFYSIFNISNSESDPSAMASRPHVICFCEESRHRPNCDLPDVYYTRTFPGQEFSIRLAVLGAPPFDGVVHESVRAFFNYSTNAMLGLSQNSQAASRASCENFNYSVHTTESDNVTFKITRDQIFLETVTVHIVVGDELYVNVFLMDCLLGFSMSSQDGGECVCDPVFSNNGVQCNINDQSFLPPNNSWIGFINNFTACNKTGVLFHPNCPTGYCFHGVRFTSNSSDSQCESHRTGLLCGECKEGYSLTLGSGKCLKCSNTYLLLVLPLAVAGLLVVAVLFTLQLTVSEGSINGLIFYANVMGMNHVVLFSRTTTGYSYLHMFLAWLNLDLGISTCLFDGLDGYTETWLQFIFPVYLWMIVLAIIWLYSKFPTLAIKLGGENAVAVLATLILLSYTKLQRTVVTIMSFTTLEYPDGVVRYVWLYDANVEFFRGKHLFIGIAGILVLVLLIVPYTLCLAFFQQLQACSDRRPFLWVNKLKPVFDAYAGPYKDKYRFWTGMLLVTRTLLIILFTANTAGSVELDLLIISVVSSTLLLASSNGVYKKWPYNYLESFFYLQLIVFAAGVAYAKLTNGSIAAVVDTSFGSTLAVFVAVLVYHVLRRVVAFRKCYYRLKGYDDVDEDDASINREHMGSSLRQIY